MPEYFDQVLSTVVLVLAIFVPVFFLRELIMSKKDRRFRDYEKYRGQTEDLRECKMCMKKFAPVQRDDEYCLNCVSYRTTGPWMD